MLFGKEDGVVGFVVESIVWIIVFGFMSFLLFGGFIGIRAWWCECGRCVIC